MAISLGTAIVASAIAGSGAAIYAGNQQSKAIKNAANVSQQAADKQLEFAREARDHATRVLSKYSAEGDAARGKMNSFLGLKPTASGFYSGGLGGADYAGYVESNPDLKQAFAALDPTERARIAGKYDLNNDGQLGQDEYGAYHYNAYGKNEGRQVQQTPTQTEGEAQEDAWASYEASPWGKIGVMEAGKARDDFTSMAGAQGSALSGRTARGMAEVAEESKLRNFEKYYGALGGVADTGYSADTGIASGGQNFANTAINVLGSNARLQSDAAIAKGQNTANTIGDLASWVGWGLGSLPSSGGGAGTGASASHMLRPSSRIR